jgi:hypothetical protein
MKKIDHKIDDDDDDDDQIRHHHHRPVEVADRIDDQLAHARSGKDRFRHHCKGDQPAERHADHGDDGDQDVAQDMHHDDAPLAPALGARSSDEILRLHLQHTQPR